MSDQDYLAISEMPGVENFLSDAFGRLDRMKVSPRICVAIVAEIQLMLKHRLRETPDLMGGRNLEEELAEARRQIGIKYLSLVGEFPQDKKEAGLGKDGGPAGWVARSARMPTNDDADETGKVWWFYPPTQWFGELTYHGLIGFPEFSGRMPTHWQRTNLRRPAAPKS